MFQKMLQGGGSGGGLNWTKIGESLAKNNASGDGTSRITFTESLDNFKGIAVVLYFNDVLSSPAVIPIDVLLSTERKRISTRFGANEVNAEFIYVSPNECDMYLAVNSSIYGKVLIYGVN